MAEVPELLTVDETAELIRRSPEQLRYMITTGQAPKSALVGGRRRMFKKSDVIAWINAAFDDTAVSA